MTLEEEGRARQAIYIILRAKTQDREFAHAIRRLADRQMRIAFNLGYKRAVEETKIDTYKELKRKIKQALNEL